MELCFLESNMKIPNDHHLIPEDFCSDEQKFILVKGEFNTLFENNIISEYYKKNYNIKLITKSIPLEIDYFLATEYFRDFGMIYIPNDCIFYNLYIPYHFIFYIHNMEQFSLFCLLNPELIEFIGNRKELLSYIKQNIESVSDDDE